MLTEQRSGDLGRCGGSVIVEVTECGHGEFRTNCRRQGGIFRGRHGGDGVGQHEMAVPAGATAIPFALPAAPQERPLRDRGVAGRYEERLSGHFGQGACSAWEVWCRFRR